MDVLTTLSCGSLAKLNHDIASCMEKANPHQILLREQLQMDDGPHLDWLPTGISAFSSDQGSQVSLIGGYPGQTAWMLHGRPVE